MTDKFISKIKCLREFPGSPVVRTPLLRAWVRSLVGELKSHKPHSMAKKIIIIFKMLKKRFIVFTKILCFLGASYSSKHFTCI